MSSSNGAVARMDQSAAVDQVGNRAVTPMEMLNQAVERGANLDVIEKLMTLQERWQANQARREFDAAMAEAKAAMPIISKNRAVDFTSAKGRTNYRHEDLGEITRVVTPILAAQGLSFRFRTSTENKLVTVTCIISHRDGHSEENTLVAAHDDSGNKNGIQALGSAITYLQRYTLKAALGLAASNDDDAKAATAPPKCIASNQAVLLRAEMQDRGVDEVKFCDFAGVERLEDLSADLFDDAVAKIRMKKKISEANHGS